MYSFYDLKYQTPRVNYKKCNTVKFLSGYMYSASVERTAPVTCSTGPSDSCQCTPYHILVCMLCCTQVLSMAVPSFPQLTNCPLKWKCKVNIQ